MSDERHENISTECANIAAPSQIDEFAPLKTFAALFAGAAIICAAIDGMVKRPDGPIGQFVEAMAKLAEPLVRLAADWKRCEVFEQTGWLPHYTSPLDLVDDHFEDTSGVSEKLESYYRTNWPDIEARFSDMQRHYLIDDRARSVFQQALTIQASGFYPLVPRALFPELERLSRVQFGKGPFETVTSQRDLIRTAGELPLSAAYPGGLYVLKLFKRLIEHLYVRVTPQNIDQILADFVPNRHAAMHGFAAYDTYRSGLNALIMADYIFQLLSAAKEGEGAVAEVHHGKDR